MFNLDLEIIRFLYLKCKSAGEIFGFGAFEGAVIYAGMITLAFLQGSKKKC